MSFAPSGLEIKCPGDIAFAMYDVCSKLTIKTPEQRKLCQCEILRVLFIVSILYYLKQASKYNSSHSTKL